jgi:hypothetical protein
MSRLRCAVLALVVCAILAAAAPPLASAAEPVRATLDGEQVSLEQARTLSCHDFDYPVLTCFRTASEMLAAAAVSARHQGSGAATLLAASAPYVVVYVDGAYGGAARAISQSYAYLSDIGWNDCISSLRSYGAAGYFTDNSPSGGFVYRFYGTTQVSYVGDAYNDKFSAVYLA